MPLIYGEDDQLVLDLVDLSELHLYIGVTNKLWHSLFKAMVNDIEQGHFHKSVHDWAYDMSIVPCKYRGEDLNGPNCQKLLKKLDSLLEFVHPKFHKFVLCMKLFGSVAEACFGSDILMADWPEKVKSFEDSYRALGISVTPKVHIIFHEMPIYLRKFKIPLGVHSEQFIENIHCDIKSTSSCFMRYSNLVHRNQK